ncbi:hypothetical protein TWF694_004541 [Orbilia ellipsospora]|uniref:Ankyrin repeat protein n=1 Tax=Orbilia ellipsospora TaxID=2528407 RepID=A0AAV9WWR7_9PEZI
MLNGVADIPAKRIKKWITRNITFTEMMIPTEESTKVADAVLAIQPFVQIRTPPAEEIHFLLVTKRHIPLSTVYSLPIWQASRSLNQWATRHLAHQADTQFSISTLPRQPHFALLRCIIYQLSNNLIDEYSEEIDQLLDKVNEMRARKQLSELLSDTSVSILATSPSLIEERFTSVINAIPILDITPIWLFEPNPFSFTEAPPRLHLPYVLERFLAFGAQPNDTEFWQFSVWKAWTYSKDNNLFLKNTKIELLDVLINAGANIDRDLSDELAEYIGKAQLPNKTVSVTISFPIKAIDVAFSLLDSLLFCYLLSKTSNVDSLVQRIRSYAHCENIVTTEFIRAVQQADINNIQKHWGQRIQDYRLQFASVLERGDVQSAKTMILEHRYRSVMPSLVSAAFTIICKRLPETALYDSIVPIFQSLLAGGYNFSQITEELEPKCEDEYLESLCLAMASHKIYLMDLLITLCIGSSPTDNLASRRIDSILLSPKVRVNMVSKAASINVEILKVLVQKGFSVTESYFSSGTWGSEIVSPLGRALTEGNMNSLTYLLQEGVDIYAPCTYYTSAIAQSVFQGRLDALALFLAVDPGCYMIALEATEDRRASYQYIKEFLANWKPATQVDPIDSCLLGNIFDSMESLAL